MSVVKAFQYFTVAGFLNAAVISVLLLMNRKNHLAKMFLVALVLTVTFQAILNAFDNREFFLAFPHLSRVSWLTPSLFGPLVYLFTAKLCMERPKLSRADLLHFIPFLLYLCILAPWFLLPADEKIRVLSDFETARKDDFGVLNQFSIFLILGYLIMTLRYLRKFRKEIENTFSDVSRKRLEWMSWFTYLVLLLLVLSAAAFYGHKWKVPVLDLFYHYTYFLIVLLVYWITYKALLQPVIFDEIRVRHSGPSGGFPPIPAADDADPGSSEKYLRSGLDPETAENMFALVSRYMEHHKPFLNPEINIFQLSEKLDVKKHHLSQVINEKAGVNFFDYINRFRVEEVKNRLADAGMRKMTLLGIAFDSGFNSKATFNTAFKKVTGMTPSEYLKHQDK